MFNPAKALEVIKAELTKDPQAIHKWNEMATKDPAGVRKAILDKALEHGVKMSEGNLKMALKMAAPFLGKLDADRRKQAEELIKKIS